MSKPTESMIAYIPTSAGAFRCSRKARFVLPYTVLKTRSRNEKQKTQAARSRAQRQSNGEELHQVLLPRQLRVVPYIGKIIEKKEALPQRSCIL